MSDPELASGWDPSTEYIGLHVTSTELDVWRDRARNGPYRSGSDVSKNSPGDWERIERQADLFLSDPSWRHWQGNTTNDCYARGDPAPENEPSSYMRDAAFYYLITEDTAYRDAVKGELLALAREPGLDFTNGDRWCTGYLTDGNPMLEIGNWLSQLLIAYDYLGYDEFSAEERAQLDTWFLKAAHFFKDEVHFGLSKNFEDRLTDDYRLTSYARSMNESTTKTSHYGGWDIYSLQAFYNNRRATSVRFFALVGIKMNDAELKSHAKRFVKEFITYSMFSDGIVGDFERWESSLPDKGWGYSAAVLSSVVTVADALARVGDRELFEFSTEDGAYGTESKTPKDILLGIRNHQSYLLDGNDRYGTDSASDVGDIGFLIDGAHAPSGWYSIADVTLANANTYYRDHLIRSIYTRTHPETSPYPSEPAARGHAPAWNGDWGLYPGLLFMFGGLEDSVHPYGDHP